jgi:hypothetical protein
MGVMKIIVNQREYDYVSDYPDGWKFSAGDPYKYPVSIGGNSCFIKRFEQKSPEDISGWDVLVKISGKYENNLSRVYDIKNVQEDDKDIYYVFYEYLDGVTLDRTIKDRSPINLNHLNTDLFNAIRALQKYEFWFADFTEKNIFSQKDGSYVLVDVDSTQRVFDVPDNDMYGSKDYWILVLKFYKEILGKNDLRLSDINGITLNYLQIPFLVLRCKLANGSAKDYSSTPMFSQLPAKLNEMVPEIKDVFSTVIRNGKQPLSVEDIAKVEDLVEKKIINSEYVPDVDPAPVSLPVIQSFTTSSKEIESGATFTMSWQVENANKLELYKNGAKFQGLQLSQKDITLKEFADGTRQQSIYQLIAYKDLNIAKSEPVTIHLKEIARNVDPPPNPPKPSKLIPITIAVVVIGALAFFILKNFFFNSHQVRVKDNILYEDSIVTFYGKDLPGINEVHLLFDGIAGEIRSAAPDSLLAIVPKLRDTTDGYTGSLAMTNNAKTIYTALYTVRNNSIHLIDSAFKAKWERGIITADGNSLNPLNDEIQSSWPGRENDGHGSAKTGSYVMEDANTYTVLRTHPWWLPNGSIRGYFPSFNIGGKKVFRAQGGFIKDTGTNQKSTDGVSFQVWVHYMANGAGKNQKIYDQHKDYDEKLMNISADLPTDVSGDFTIELRVDAGNASNVDWAAWIDPRVISKGVVLNGAK